MTFRSALFESGLRFIGLNLALVLLALPAKWLRAAFFPEGLSGTILLLVILALLCAACILLVTYVSAPIRYWWEEKEEHLRGGLEQ